MHLKSLELAGFKSFAKKTDLFFESQVTAIVGPNGSGKSNVAEAFRWVLGEQSLKSLRGKRGEDLIFNGSGQARHNRATVTVVFDNQDKRLPFDFEEVAVTRTVFRDGSNEYKINNSVVRLKDVVELFSAVSLGSSGHHIISQGEADRILNANLKERREMIEEALGLKIYQWKILESEKKLLKTEENIRQVESLRREIAPHLRFLKKQVEKIEKADELRRELKRLCLEYFFREDLYLKAEEEVLKARRSEPQAAYVATSNKLAELEVLLSTPVAGAGNQLKAIEHLDQSLRSLRGRHEDLTRSLGRLEGMIEVRQEQVIPTLEDQPVPLEEVKSLADRLAAEVEAVGQTAEVSKLQAVLLFIKEELQRFIFKHQAADTGAERKREESLELLLKEKGALLAEEEGLVAEEAHLVAERSQTVHLLEAEKAKTQGAERELYELRARRSELSAVLNDISAREEKLGREQAVFKAELEEAVVLVDSEVADFRRLLAGTTLVGESREVQEIRHRDIEKIKIRLEDMGVEGGDVLTEYKETTERDAFLESELEDLHHSAGSLGQVMAELKERLLVEFKEGIEKINHEFSNYFSLMFGGGTARLEVVAQTKRRRSALEMNLGGEEEMESEADEEGIDIFVNLPRKKIKGLMMMSGGERALTSIALLFAMSQVNPPPFIILDETDAALDEANSKKYGDMIERLAKESQLILITHNRETMSRASVIYGVTMGGDGMSKLLSIKFDEAAASWAK
ncbi:MAG: hypothetical protein A2589_01925 [Candidatus Vogelbacteria bacterium RIFOXYD1_FULL_46_19]|uniref:RecF/RecN/SMC N-terminal domain-containing protein n=1 Tax=Candidatus Vogelbacteria bacterium RIFOXYD1_FULL_46_19 TaxID=1802439 RepID=A0A1G2QGQ8_9BACT|nr:MAG: hypothetical protein A2589_01925 [Candidatus Vogelbacteria bacterium RIFOXYD1_FULL_46_19]